MKKLTLLLMPVMPGFEAWAVNGFVEYAEKCDDATNKPEAIQPPLLKALVQGFTLPAGDMVFVSYTHLGSVIRSLVNMTSDCTVRPLDRGGVLVSGTLTQTGIDRIGFVLNNESDDEKPVSKSK